MFQILVLGARALARDDEPAFGVETARRKPAQARLDGIRKCERGLQVEAQVNLGRNLVDVLPTGSRSAHGPAPELTGRDDQVGSNV